MPLNGKSDVANDSKTRLTIAFAIACALSGVAHFGAVRMYAQGPGVSPRIVPGTRVDAISSAVVNFDELSRQEALAPRASTVTAEAVPEPGEMEEMEPVGAPPASPAPVDRRSPSIASPSPALSFEGEVDQAKGGGTVGTYTIPPDTMGAVGPDSVNKVFTTLNNNFKIQNKTTGAQLSLVSMSAFWAPSGATSPFDPRVQYDPYNDRWLLAAVTEAGTATTSILIGISQTNDPSGSYALYKVSARIGADTPVTNFADFPMLGFNKNWVVVTINMFGATFVESRALVIDYPTLRAGTFSATYFTGGTLNTVFSLHPATTYSSTEETEYLVDHRSSAGAVYGLSTITGTAAAPVLTLGGNKTRPGGGWTPPDGNILPQATGTCTSTPLKVDVGDAYVRMNVVYRNGTIWYGQTIGLPAGGLTHTAAQWTQLNTSGDVVQGGRIDDSTADATNGGKWYAYPSIAVNANNDMLLSFGQFSSAQFASGGYAYRDHSDAAGTIRDSLVFKAGDDCYSKDFGSGSNRWGDYSHTMVDPTSGSNSFWTVQEFAKPQAAPTVGGSTSKWGTFWAKVNPPGGAPFTDDPLTPQVSVVKAVHVAELRTRVNAIRATHGLGAFSFTDPTLTAQSTIVKAIHITELRTALNDAYVAAAVTPPLYTDPGLAAGTTVKAVHIAELRAAVLALE